MGRNCHVVASRARETPAASLRVVLPILMFLASFPSSAGELVIAGRRTSYDEAERMLRTEPLPVVAARHNPKSEVASTIELELEGGWRAKLRLVEDLGASRRNEDPKLDVAAYVVARWLFDAGACVYPSVLRRIDVASLLPHLDADAAARLVRWSDGRSAWVVVSLVGERAVRASDSPWYGGWAAPEPRARPGDPPPDYYRSIGDMNVLAVLVHNGDMRTENWEIRHEDGSCFIVDHGVSFLHDDYVVPHRLWRRPCELVAPALAASTIARVRRLASAPGELDRELAHLQGTPFGLPPEARAVVAERARRLLGCLDSGDTFMATSQALMARLATGEIRPFRDRLGRRQPVVIVSDW